MSNVEIFESVVIKHRVLWPNKNNSRYGWQYKILRIFFSPFENEIRIYRALEKANFLYAPKLLSFDKRSITIERIYPNQNLTLKKNLDNTFKSMHDFTNTAIHVKSSVYDIFGSPMNRILLGATLLILKNPVSSFTIFKLVVEFIIVTNSFNKHYLIHKDLSFEKNSFIVEDKYFLFDFEKTIKTKRFYLLDIVDFSIQKKVNNSLIIRFDYIRSYIKYLGYCKVSFQEIVLQLRLIFWRKYFLTNDIYEKKFYRNIINFESSEWFSYLFE